MADPRTARLQRLLEPVHERARSFARSIARSRAEGDDLFHEALVRALAKLDGLRDDAAFRTWLFRVVINAHRNRTRRAFWRRVLPMRDVPASERDEVAYRVRDWSADAAQAQHRARQALAALPTQMRESIVLFEIEGWRVEEIAALHRISASAVKSRLSRGRERMREFYERRFGASPIPTLEES